AWLAGVLFGLAYLAKAIAFPLALMLTATTASLRAAIGERVIGSFSRTLAGFAILALPWVALLSLKYGAVTFSVTAPIAHAVIGPPDVERFHPLLRGFQAPSPGRITTWEEPSELPYAYWSPFESREYAVHQLRQSARNLRTIAGLVRDFDLAGIGLASILLCFAVMKGVRDRLARERWRWAALPVVCLAAIYSPVFVDRTEYRFFYPAYPFVLVASFGVAALLASAAWKRHGAWSGLGRGVVTLSFGVPAAMLTLLLALPGIENPASTSARDVAARLRARGITGSIAGGAEIQHGRAGLYLAFFLGEPWYGTMLRPTATDLKGSGAELIAVSRHEQRELVAELDRDPSIRDLDSRLFRSSEEARRCPLKVYALRPHR
ncbi:MAG: hypothetical protein ACREQ9_13170, partial [Candidatus Binatia bacterium]